jgi:hypothetical protein
LQTLLLYHKKANYTIVTILAFVRQVFFLTWFPVVNAKFPIKCKNWSILHHFKILTNNDMKETGIAGGIMCIYLLHMDINPIGRILWVLRMVAIQPLFQFVYKHHRSHLKTSYVNIFIWCSYLISLGHNWENLKWSQFGR